MQRFSVFAGIILMWIASSGIVVAQTGKGFESISAAEARREIVRDSSIIALDVRTRQEFRSETGHLFGAILIPVEALERRVGELSPYKHRTIIAYCRSGVRSATAAALLAKKGFRVKNLDGGILSWNESHLPVVRENAE